MYGVNPAGIWRRNLTSMRYNVATLNVSMTQFQRVWPIRKSSTAQPHGAKKSGFSILCNCLLVCFIHYHCCVFACLSLVM